MAADQLECAAAAPLARLVNVRKQFGRTVAVAGIDLELHAGEFFSLLGPSGCGKTSTLRMLAGFEEPSSGQIFVDGHDMANVPPFRRPINTVFQNYALFPHMSVADNVGFGLRLQKANRSDARRRVADALEMVEMTAFARRRPGQLSGGQQQRVALARALILRPRLLLLDEPLGALDTQLRRSLQIELKALQRAVGISFLYITHDQEEALSMSDRLGVMNQGRLEQVGEPNDLYLRPRSAFVASFLGVGNILDAVSTGNGCVEIDRVVLRTLGPDVPKGRTLTVLIRPESIRLGASSDADTTPLLTGIVTGRRFVGPLSELNVQLRSGATVCAHQPNSVEPAPGVGDRVSLWIDGSSTHILPSPDERPARTYQSPSNAAVLERTTQRA